MKVDMETAKPRATQIVEHLSSRGQFVLISGDFEYCTRMATDLVAAAPGKQICPIYRSL